MHRYIVYIYDNWKSFCDHSNHTRTFFVNGNSAAGAITQAKKHVASNEFYRCMMDEFATK